LCIRCISLILTLFFKASYNFACNFFSSAEAFLQSIVFQSDIFNPFIIGMYKTHLFSWKYFSFIPAVTLAFPFRGVPAELIFIICCNRLYPKSARFHVVHSTI
jgi:hypothetical protein